MTMMLSPGRTPTAWWTTVGCLVTVCPFSSAFPVLNWKLLQAFVGDQAAGAGVEGSVPNRGMMQSSSHHQAMVKAQHSQFIEYDERDSSTSVASRRQALEIAAAASLGMITAVSSVPAAIVSAATEGSTTMGSSPEHPIVILGAGGKVGKICTQLLRDRGLYTRAVTRSGRSLLDESDFISYAAADVTQYDALVRALQGASGVIFAASASGKKKGGDPAHVDYLGLYQTAKACLQCGVPKLVVVSAATVSRPESLGFKATNFAVKFVYGEKIMDYKIAGEALMRDMYEQAAQKRPPGQPPLAYTVVRPGGLTDRPSIGAPKVHVSQGDVYASEISREDVALVTVAALLKGPATDFTTIEVNQVEGVAKAMGSLPDSPAELVHAGAASFDRLLDGLLTDRELKQRYNNLVSDFRGDGVEPVEKLLA